MTTRVRTPTVRDGVGVSTSRTDGIPKVDGTYLYSSDLYMDRMLFGATLRCPHPKARITRLDIGPAVAMTGVPRRPRRRRCPGQQCLRSGVR